MPYRPNSPGAARGHHRGRARPASAQSPRPPFRADCNSAPGSRRLCRSPRTAMARPCPDRPDGRWQERGPSPALRWPRRAVRDAAGRRSPDRRPARTPSRPKARTAPLASGPSRDAPDARRTAFGSCLRHGLKLGSDGLEHVVHHHADISRCGSHRAAGEGRFGMIFRLQHEALRISLAP